MWVGSSLFLWSDRTTRDPVLLGSEVLLKKNVERPLLGRLAAATPPERRLGVDALQPHGESRAVIRQAEPTICGALRAPGSGGLSLSASITRRSSGCRPAADWFRPVKKKYSCTHQRPCSVLTPGSVAISRYSCDAFLLHARCLLLWRQASLRCPRDRERHRPDPGELPELRCPAQPGHFRRRVSACPWAH